MPGSRSTRKGATTRRAADAATSGPSRGVEREYDRRDGGEHAAQAEREPHAADVDGERQQRGRHEAAERDRHLAHAEREPAPLGREAVEDRDGRSHGHDRAGDAAREEGDAEADGIGQERARHEQQPARGSRIQEGLARARAIHDHPGRDQRDGVAERRRVDERAETGRAEVVALPGGRARSRRGPTARSRSRPGTRARG